MSPIAAGLDGLLALLLIAALVLGARLNARLKALRDGQAGFAAAVLELNQAAARAEAGLNALKSAQEETHDMLLDRIEVARGLAAKLERAGADADRRAAQAPPPPAEPAPRATATAPGGALAAIAALAEGRTPGRATDPAPDAAAARATPPPRRKPARDTFDEELFEAKPSRRSDPLGLGALRPEPAKTKPAAAAPAADLGPLSPPSPDEPLPRPDPLRKWKAIR
jgi:hypothetical protein